MYEKTNNLGYTLIFKDPDGSKVSYVNAAGTDLY